MHKVPLAEGEYYHVFNRGVEKRDVFLDRDDLQRFLESMREFNVGHPIGSLFERRFAQGRRTASLGSLTPKSKLVDVVCYCLNPNHFHILLRQSGERGISKFMQKVGTGYTNYFNEKYRRSGGLFQGTYKTVHIESNEQLLHVSAYINLNNRLGSLTPKLSASSWDAYSNLGKPDDMCERGVILEQFKMPDGYRLFAEQTLPAIIDRKQKEKEMQWLLGS